MRSKDMADEPPTHSTHSTHSAKPAPENLLNGLFVGIIRRIVIISTLTIFSLQLIFIPLYLGVALDRALEAVVNRAVLSTALFAANPNFSAQTRAALYKRHKLRGVINGADEVMWFINPPPLQNAPQNAPQNLNKTRMINLNQGNFLRSYIRVMFFLQSTQNNNVIITSAPPDTGVRPDKEAARPNSAAHISVIIDEQVIAGQLQTGALRIAIITMVLDLFIAFCLYRVLGYELKYSLRRVGAVFGIYSRRSEGRAQMAENLEQHLREQTKLAFIGNGATKLAHDLRNVLASLQLYAERLSNFESARDRKMGERMMDSIKRAVTLCDWTKSYSSPKRKNIIRHVQDVRPLVDEVIGLVQLHDAHKKVRLFNQCDQTHMIDCDRSLVFRIIYNITLNAIQAIQASDEAGKIFVRSIAHKDGMSVQIEDTGPGMNASMVKKLFVPYEGGLQPVNTGLGVTISEELARWHGGSLELLKTNNEGSCFQFFIPHQGLNREETA